MPRYDGSSFWVSCFPAYPCRLIFFDRESTRENRSKPYPHESPSGQRARSGILALARPRLGSGPRRAGEPLLPADLHGERFSRPGRRDRTGPEGRDPGAGLVVGPPGLASHTERGLRDARVGRDRRRSLAPVAEAWQGDRPPGASAQDRRRSPQEGRDREGQDGRRARPRCPSLLVLGQDSQAETDHLLDLVRGRVDSAEPSPDRRRNRVRTNQEGAEFQPPASAQAWRDRASHVREQMLVALGLWPMPPKTPLNPRSTASSTATATRSRRSCSRRCPGSRSAATSTGRRATSGKVPGMLCPHGHWEDGRVNPEVQQRCIRWAKLGCGGLHVRHGRLQRQQAVHACFPERSPAALGAQPGLAPDLEQHPGAGLAHLAARRRLRPDRLHGRVGRGHADVSADGARPANQGRRAGGHGLRLVPGRLRLRERRRAAARHRQRRVRRAVPPRGR